MKAIIIFLFMLLSIEVFAQRSQEGQTCLFTVLHKINPDKSVGDYINDFNIYTHTNGDIVKEGAKATSKQIIDFVSTEFETVKGVTLLQALDLGYDIMSTVQLQDEEGNTVYHEILFTGYKSKDIKNPAKILLQYFDPMYGSVHNINMLDWSTSPQLYFIPIKAKSANSEWVEIPTEKVSEYMKANYSNYNYSVSYKAVCSNAVYLSYTVDYVDGGGRTGIKSNSSFSVKFVILKGGTIRILFDAYEKTIEYNSI